MGVSNDTNATRYMVEGPEFFKQVWILSQVTTVIFLLFCLWAIVALCNYGIRKNKWNRAEKNRQQLILMTLAVFAPSVTIIRVLLTQTVIIVGLVSNKNESGDFACEIAMDLSVGFFFMSTIPTYLFLWKRQRILYSNPSLKRLNTTFVNILSYVAICMLLIGGLGSCVLFIVPTGYQMSDFGCVKSQLESTNPIPFYVGAAAMITSQLMIFGLFVHPLRLHKKNNVTVNTPSSDSNGGGGESMKNRLKRANVLATTSMAICTFSDLFSLVLVAIVLPKTTPRDLSSTIYDLSLAVNILSIMLSYEDYKEIMLGAFSSSDDKVTLESSDVEMKTASTSANNL